METKKILKVGTKLAPKKHRHYFLAKDQKDFDFYYDVSTYSKYNQVIFIARKGILVSPHFYFYIDGNVYTVYQITKLKTPLEVSIANMSSYYLYLSYKNSNIFNNETFNDIMEKAKLEAVDEALGLYKLLENFEEHAKNKTKIAEIMNRTKLQIFNRMRLWERCFPDIILSACQKGGHVKDTFLHEEAFLEGGTKPAGVLQKYTSVVNIMYNGKFNKYFME